MKKSLFLLLLVTGSAMQAPEFGDFEPTEEQPTSVEDIQARMRKYQNAQPSMDGLSSKADQLQEQTSRFQTRTQATKNPSFGTSIFSSASSGVDVTPSDFANENTSIAASRGEGVSVGIDDNLNVRFDGRNKAKTWREWFTTSADSRRMDALYSRYSDANDPADRDLLKRSLKEHANRVRESWWLSMFESGKNAEKYSNKLGSGKDVVVKKGPQRTISEYPEGRNKPYKTDDVFNWQEARNERAENNGIRPEVTTQPGRYQGGDLGKRVDAQRAARPRNQRLNRLGNQSESLANRARGFNDNTGRLGRQQRKRSWFPWF